MRRSSPERSLQNSCGSEGISCLRLLAAEFGRTELVRQLIEHRVDHPGLFLVDKSAGHVDIFGRDHPRGYILSARELVSAGPQHGAKHHFDALERPAARQRRVNRRIQATLLSHHAADYVAEIGGFRRTILHAFHVALEPMTFELSQNLIQASASKLHLVERLDGCKPRDAALIGFAAAASTRATGYFAAGHRTISRPAA